MKVIFLDFDGIVNNIRDNSRLVVYECVQNLKKIIEATNARIVVTSSRKNEFIGKENIKLEETVCYQYFLLPLKNMGIEIYDYAPFLNGDKLIEKELEVEFYLKEHSEIEEYVILDDDIIMDKFLEHQVFIEYSNGLQEEHINPAISILNGQLGFYPPNYDRTETYNERVKRILGASPFLEDCPCNEIDELEKALFKTLNLKL